MTSYNRKPVVRTVKSESSISKNSIEEGNDNELAKLSKMAKRSKTANNHLSGTMPTSELAEPNKTTKMVMLVDSELSQTPAENKIITAKVTAQKEQKRPDDLSKKKGDQTKMLGIS